MRTNRTATLNPANRVCVAPLARTLRKFSAASVPIVERAMTCRGPQSSWKWKPNIGNDACHHAAGNENASARKVAAPTAIAADMPPPTTNRIHQKRNAAGAPKVSRRNTYSPPARGISVQSSAYESAPASVSNPATIHAAISRGAVPISCIMEAERMKIPVPTIELTTMPTTWIEVRPRRRLDSSGRMLTARVVEPTDVTRDAVLVFYCCGAVDAAVAPEHARQTSKSQEVPGGHTSACHLAGSAIGKFR